MKRKKIIYYLIIFSLMGAYVALILYINYLFAKSDEKFKNAEVNCVVVEVKPAPNGLVTAYVCNNGYKFHERLIFTIHNEEVDSGIRVGDSISKKANDPVFRVYRKNEKGEYELYGIFKIMA